MQINISSNTNQRIDKAMKQLPYKQSKDDFITTAIDSHLEELFVKKELKQRV